MAIAERWLATTFNRPDHSIIDHHTYVIASDGDLMEGISSEAASLAGELRLGRLIVLYDSNRITLSATTNLTFSEDVGLVLPPADGRCSRWTGWTWTPSMRHSGRRARRP